jgi:hypothetical protein
VKVLLLIAWALVALEAIFVIVMTITANSSGQDAAGRGTASGLAVAAGLVLAAMSGSLLFSSRNGSVAGVAVAIVMLGFPLFVLGAPMIEQAFNHIREKRDAARKGRFVNPELSAIVSAVASNDMDGMRALLAKRPDLDDRDETGETLLAYAVENALEKNGSIEPVRALLDAGTDPNQRLLTDGRQIIVKVFESTSPSSNDLFKLLLDRRADPDTRDNFGVPMIHHAKGQLLKLKLLIDSDVDINTPSDYHYQHRWTPAMSLAMDEAYDEALYLVQRGADVHHIASDGSTLSSVLERRRMIASESGSDLPDSFKALVNAVTVYARRQ